MHFAHRVYRYFWVSVVLLLPQLTGALEDTPLFIKPCMTHIGLHCRCAHERSLVQRTRAQASLLFSRRSRTRLTACEVVALAQNRRVHDRLPVQVQANPEL